ncbi:MAG: TIGR02281 family clan AA aspartic protease [Brevundimonas sp.]
MRIDLSSFGVMALAVASALSAAWWLVPADARGRAHAAVPAAHAAGPARALKAGDGHYWAEALIDGKPVRMMVDTGASLVVLTPADAIGIGFDVRPDDYSGTLMTASGPVRAAPVALRSVTVGEARVERVDALIVEKGLPHSLLGMSYLGRLSAFTATPAEITLRR